MKRGQVLPENRGWVLQTYFALDPTGGPEQRLYRSLPPEGPQEQCFINSRALPHLRSGLGNHYLLPVEFRPLAAISLLTD